MRNISEVRNHVANRKKLMAKEWEELLLKGAIPKFLRVLFENRPAVYFCYYKEN